jgi:hypothetical protein
MKHFTYLISIVVCFSFISCSSTYVVMTKEKPVAIDADSQNATLVIYRSTAYKFNMVVSNYLNDQFIGQTTGKSYFVSSVKPGTYYLIGKSDEFSCRKIAVEAGKVYYILQAIYPEEHYFIPKLPDDFMKDERDLTYFSIVSDPHTVYPALKEEEFKKACEQYDKLATSDSKHNRDLFNLKGY